MTILAYSYEYDAFKRSNTKLKKRVQQWPRQNNSSLTAYIPRVADALRKMLAATDQLRELVSKTRGTNEINECMAELSAALSRLWDMLTGCLNALERTYHRIHGRTLMQWDAIGSMWPSCSIDIHTGAFKDIVRRIVYTDGLDDMDRRELDSVVQEIASAETALSCLVGEGVRIKGEFARSGAILTDPNNEYNFDASG